MLALDLHAVSLDQEKLDGLCNYMQMFLRMEASFCQTEGKKIGPTLQMCSLEK